MGRRRSKPLAPPVEAPKRTEMGGAVGSPSHLVPEDEIELAMELRRCLSRGEPPHRIRARLGVSEEKYARILPHITAHTRDFYPLWDTYVARTERYIEELSELADDAEDNLVLKKDCVIARARISEALVDMAIKMGLLKIAAAQADHLQRHSNLARTFVEELLRTRGENVALPPMRAMHGTTRAQD